MLRVLAAVEQDLAQLAAEGVGEGVDARVRRVLDVRGDEELVVAVGEGRAPLVDGLHGLRRVALEQEEGAGDLGDVLEALVDVVEDAPHRRHVERLEPDREPQRGQPVRAPGPVAVLEGEGCELVRRGCAGLDHDGLDVVQGLGILARLSLGPVVDNAVPQDRLAQKLVYGKLVAIVLQYRSRSFTYVFKVECRRPDNITPVDGLCRLGLLHFVVKGEEGFELVPSEHEYLVRPFRSLGVGIVYAVLPLGHKTKVVAGAPDSPEQVRVRVFGYRHHFAAAEDEPRRYNLVSGKAVFTLQPTMTATKNGRGHSHAFADSGDWGPRSEQRRLVTRARASQERAGMLTCTFANGFKGRDDLLDGCTASNLGRLAVSGHVDVIHLAEVYLESILCEAHGLGRAVPSRSSEEGHVVLVSIADLAVEKTDL